MLKKIYHPEIWRHQSPETEGLHQVITAENSECRILNIMRLNLKKGRSFELDFGNLEINAGIIEGEAELAFDGGKNILRRLDSFYLPGGRSAKVIAKKDLVVYIGAAPYENVGEFFIRRLDLSLPIGEIHQVHGKPPYEREVFMTLDHGTPASRLIAGFTWSRDGAWTSWPPHQHEKDLEEVYCYFDMPEPAFGLHLSYLDPGKPGVAHKVGSGTFVEAPVGYHPTVASPGCHNTYFWVLGAHDKTSRRYDLAISDPHYDRK